ncbi:hypothetical protein T07_2066 [Trichinella nelsoni]|uniref:Uncharacterized protein n=1 Tax=Trichinella nelsoni TaxID=6336 RepID=A0A0V0RMQ5_9BILA|nr:hypothetical protein T07_2066 [Trichinella nelsoni]
MVDANFKLIQELTESRDVTIELRKVQTWQANLPVFIIGLQNRIRRLLDGHGRFHLRQQAQETVP